MCSIRKAGVAAMAMGLAMSGVVGCQFHSDKPPKMNLNQSPLIVDEAMQKRDWDRTTIQYANGDTIAGPHLIVIESAGPAWLQRGTDPGISTVNNAITPITTVIMPPWKDVTYQGMAIPPTYSAQPPPNPIR